MLGLAETFRQRGVEGLRLDDGELGVAILEQVVGDVGMAAAAMPFEPAEGDLVLAPNAAAGDDAPAGRGEGGIDVLGAGFGFVHAISQV